MKIYQIFAILALLSVAFGTSITDVEITLGGSVIANDGSTTFAVGECATDFIISAVSNGSNTFDSPEAYTYTIQQAPTASGTAVAFDSNVTLPTIASVDKGFTISAAEMSKVDISTNPFLILGWSDTASPADTLHTTQSTLPLKIQLTACTTAAQKIQLGGNDITIVPNTSGTAATQVYYGSCTQAVDLTFSVAAARRSLTTTYAWTLKSASAASIGATVTDFGSAVTGSAATLAVAKADLATYAGTSAYLQVAVTVTVSGSASQSYPRYIEMVACPTHTIQVDAAAVTSTTAINVGTCNTSNVAITLASARRSLTDSYTWTVQKATAANGTGNAAYTTSAINTAIATTSSTANLSIPNGQLAAMKGEAAYVRVSISGTVGGTAINAMPVVFQLLDCPTHNIQVDGAAVSSTLSFQAGSCNSSNISVTATAARRSLTDSYTWTVEKATARDGTGAAAYTTAAINTAIATTSSTANLSIPSAQLAAMLGEAAFVKVSLSGTIGGTTVVSRPVYFGLTSCPTHKIQLNGADIMANGSTTVNVGSCTTTAQEFTVTGVRRSMAASYSWTLESATGADGAGATAYTGAVATTYAAYTKNAATLSIPAADLAALKGVQAYVKVSLAYTADGQSTPAVVESRVITLADCTAPTTTTTNSQVLAFFSAVLAIIALLI